MVEKGSVGARVAAVREVSDVPQRVLASRGAQRDGDVQARSSPTRSTPARSTRATLAAFTDEGLLHDLAQRAPSPLLRALRERRLYKRAFECPGGAPRARRRRVDRRRSRADGRRRERARRRARTRSRASCCSTIRRRPRCSASICWCSDPTAKCERLTAAGWEGAINLPKLSEEFYRSARWLRVYTAPRIAIDPSEVIRLAIGARRSSSALKEESVLDW